MTGIPATPRKQPVIVVADDDAVTRYIIRKTLTHEGFAVIESANGREALDACAAQPVDLLLLDVEMPELDGYDACRSVRADDRTAQLPVVMITSHDDRESIDRAFDAGATDFIAKPISWPLLAYRLRYVLRSARNLRTLGDALEDNRALMSAMPDNIFVIDSSTRIVEHLRGDAAPWKDAGFSVVGLEIAAIFPDEVARQAGSRIATVLETGRQTAIEYRTFGAGCGPQWNECRFVHHGASRVLAIVRDISQRKLAEQRIHKLAFFDPLTGLPNRAHLKDRTEDALQRAGRSVALFAIDLDRFKRINDTLGSAIGDGTLVAVTARLRDEAESLAAMLPESDSEANSCLACFGGNVFALMLAGQLDGTDLSEVARRLGRRIAEPMIVEGHEFAITASIGVACSPQHGDSVDTLLRNAEAARSAAKMQGNDNQRMYRSSMNANTPGCFDLENELRRALERDEFDVHYQPKYSTRSGAIAGAEALLRWNHPRRGEISPDVFIPLAEEAGLICELGEWAMHRVCQQIAAWRYTGFETGPVAINLSGQDFVRSNPHASALRAVRRAGIDPADLDLEITESVLMSDIRSVIDELHALRDAGFSLAVDDFGTGYSSLRYLQRFPVDVLKIDSSFVRDVETDADSRSICAAIISMGRGLGLSVVGEGVESHWQRQFLEREGCDLLQGYLLGRPMPAIAFEARFRQGDPRRGDRRAAALSVVTQS